MDEALDAAMERSEFVSAEIRRTAGTSGILDGRDKLAMAYLSLAIEHREAVMLLVHHGAASSATALSRSLLEAFVAGAWIKYTPDVDRLEKIYSLRQPIPSFETMANKLRRIHPLGEWFEAFKSHYSTWGSYTHGHKLMITRWIRTDSIEPRYRTGQLVELLRHSDIIGILAAAHREEILKRPSEYLLSMLTSALERAWSDKPPG